MKEKIEAIRTWLKSSCDITNPAHQKALERGCLRIYANQTADEQATAQTRHLNNLGFNGRDARFGTWLATAILDIRDGRSKYKSLSPKMYEALRRMLVKYAKQIAAATKQ